MPLPAGVEVVWAPQPGSQEVALRCPVFELLYHGTRGVGKTDWLLMDYARDVGKGWGRAWRGIIFRRTYKSLEEVVEKSLRWYPRIFPGARYYKGNDPRWVFPTGEQLLLRHFDGVDDYWLYHGHEYPWVGWDELTNWGDLEGYRRMMSTCRSSVRGLPKRYRATANPWGRGHNAVKARFIDPAPGGTVIREDGLERVAIRGHWSENKILLAADPDYVSRIAASATNPAQREAWLEGSWDIVAGGLFDDVWSSDAHVLPEFQVPPSWRLDRAYDHGSSKPFSVGWWAESDGTDVIVPGRGRMHFPRGSLIGVNEWYGWNGRDPNVGLRLPDTDIAKGIAKREERWGIRDRVQPGPADTQIFHAEPGRPSIHDNFRKHGVRFVEADKRPGSRVTGWSIMRRMLAEAAKPRPEEPGMWVMESCRQFIRTVPTLPRSDRDPDDADTDAEDHRADETRYRVLAPHRGAGNVDMLV